MISGTFICLIKEKTSVVANIKRTPSSNLNGKDCDPASKKSEQERIQEFHITRIHLKESTKLLKLLKNLVIFRFIIFGNVVVFYSHSYTKFVFNKPSASHCYWNALNLFYLFI